MDNRYDTVQEVDKFNPNHDSRGRFTTAGSASSFTIRTRAGYNQGMADRSVQRAKDKHKQQSGGTSQEMKRYVDNLKPEVEYPERVDHWKQQIKAGKDRPILVSSTDENRIIDGNHTLQAYKELGKTPKIYSMDRIEFLNGAAQAKDTVDYIRQAIKDGRAKEVKKSDIVEIEEVEKFNPYHDARGRFATAGNYSSFTYKPGKSKAHDLAIQRMKQRQQAAAASSSKPAASKPSTAKPAASKPKATKPAATAAAHSPSRPKPQQPTKPTVNRDKRGFADHDDADYHQLHSGRKYYQQQKLTAKEQQAAKNYLEADEEPGSLYSHAQNMNWEMVNGRPLTGKYKQTHDGLMSAMHNIGYNVELTRYDHPGMVNSILKSVGAGTDYVKMSQSQLKKALVGRTVGENKFISTSYNDLQKMPNADVFNTRAVKINYKVKAHVQAMMPGVGPGGDQGEVILAPTTGKNPPGKITDVRLTGQKVRRKGQPRWATHLFDQPRIEIDIEIG